MDKKTQRKLKKTEPMMIAGDRLIADLLPDIIAEVDNNRVYTWLNSAGLEFFGEDAIGKEASDFFEGEQETYKKVDPLFEGREGVYYLESWQGRKDGEKRLLAWWCRPLKDGKGKIAGALSAARDITEQHKKEQELVRIKDELQEKVNQLERFNKLMIGREIKMVEMKKRIKDLEIRHGIKPD